MSTRHVLTERVAAPFAGSTADPDAGVVRGVLVCGSDSLNGRRYDWAGKLKGCHAKYEGRPVNCDHADGATVARRLGWLSNARPGPDGRPRADLHVLKSHPLAASVFEAAARNPGLFGLSHVALCSTRRVNGVEVVEGIESVESVDLVADPATTKGLYESKGAAVLKLREWVGQFARHPKATTSQILAVKRLAEDDGMGMGDMDMPAPPPEADGDADDAVMSAFKTAIGSVVDKAMSGDMDPKEALGKIKELLKSHAGLNADGTPDKDGDPATGAAEEEPAAESRKAKPPTFGDLVAEAKAAGLDATVADVVALGEIPTAAGRKAFCEAVLARVRDAKSTGEKPVSAGKKPGGEMPKKAAGTTGGVPVTAKEFAESVRR